VADIFVSYTGSDRDWAFWIAKELEALGHTPHIHEWEIESGADIYAWMEQRHDAADHVLCVVSDEYLKTPYSTLERNAAIWQAAGKRPGFVLFVAVKPSKLPTLSDHIRRCELFGIPEDAARLRFPRVHAEARSAGGGGISGESICRLKHPDPRACPFSRPPRFTRRDRGGLQPSHRGHRRCAAARPARRGQDHAGRGLCGAPSHRLSGNLVDQSANRGDAARRSRRARRSAQLDRG
jgi:hypothetical protein